MFDDIFYPEKLAVVGASPEPGSAGNEYMRVLQSFRDSDDIFPINPDYDEIFGMKTYSSISEVPEEIDLAYVLTSSKVVPEIVEDCVDKGVGGIVIMAGGFSEKGNVSLENKIVDLVEGSKTRIVGPNCMGVYSPSGKVTFPTQIPSFEFPLEDGNVSFISQSGGISEIFTYDLIERGGRISKLVSTGNESDTNFLDYLNYFAEDDTTDVISGYVEQIREGEKFIDRAKKVSENKPIILWKGGKWEVGKRAASSHTGALAGSRKIYSGVFKQTGIIEAKDLSELIAFTITFSCLEPNKVEKTGVVTIPGGLGVSIGDALNEMGIDVPVLSDDIREKLESSLPPYCQFSNPIDLTFAAIQDPSIVKETFNILAKEPDLDSIVFCDLGGFVRAESKTLRDFRENNDIPISVLISPMNNLEEKGKESIRKLTEANIPVFANSRNLAKSLKALTFRYEFVT